VKGWLPIVKMDVEVAEKVIEYKKRMSELWLDDSKKIKTTQKMNQKVRRKKNCLNQVTA
jgi:hypothetical protein